MDTHDGYEPNGSVALAESRVRELGSCPSNMPAPDFHCLASKGLRVSPTGGIALPLDKLAAVAISTLNTWTPVVSYTVDHDRMATIYAMGFEVLGGVLAPWQTRLQVNGEALPFADDVWWAKGIAGYIPGGITPDNWNDLRWSPLALAPGDLITLEAQTDTAGTIAARLWGRLYSAAC